jgi:hypothetical protein
VQQVILRALSPQRQKPTGKPVNVLCFSAEEGANENARKALLSSLFPFSMRDNHRG